MPGPVGSVEQYGYNPDRVAVRDAGLRVVRSETEHDHLKNQDGSYIKGISQVYIVKNYPKCVHRIVPGSSALETKEVASAEEELQAAKDGWATTQEELNELLSPSPKPKPSAPAKSKANAKGE